MIGGLFGWEGIAIFESQVIFLQSFVRGKGKLIKPLICSVAENKVRGTSPHYSAYTYRGSANF